MRSTYQPRHRAERRGGVLASHTRPGVLQVIGPHQDLVRTAEVLAQLRGAVLPEDE